MVNFSVGDLVADEDIFDDIIDIALVLQTPKETKGGHYTVYYCTGPTAGDVVLETPHAMAHMRLLSAGDGRSRLAKRESKNFFSNNEQPRKE